MEEKNLLKKSKAYYEDNDYYEIFSRAEDGEDIVSNYLKKVCKDKIVLDAGCGTGKFLPTISLEAIKYIGIDLSSSQLKKARSKVEKDNVILIESDLSNIKLDKESVDIVISSWVLGTIIDLDERKKCLDELKRVLKDKGTIILIENDVNSEFEIIRDRDKDDRTSTYNKWLEKNGFIVDKRINTYFNFNSLDDAIKCFQVIYGEEKASRIKKRKIEHKIVIYKYQK